MVMDLQEPYIINILQHLQHLHYLMEVTVLF
jgi:hypothetical protein